MAYERIHQTLCEELRMFQLPQVSHHQLPLCGVIAEYFLNLKETDRALDVVQVVFRTMEEMLHRTRNAWGHEVFGSRSGSENAKHDHQLFEDKWKTAAPI